VLTPVTQQHSKLTLTVSCRYESNRALVRCANRIVFVSLADGITSYYRW